MVKNEQGFKNKRIINIRNVQALRVECGHRLQHKLWGRLRRETYCAHRGRRLPWSRIP